LGLIGEREEKEREIKRWRTDHFQTAHESPNIKIWKVKYQTNVRCLSNVKCSMVNEKKKEQKEQKQDWVVG
jgi:hypothetical protein